MNADLVPPASTLFVCREWLSAAKGDGKVSRHLPALTPELTDGSDVFDMVSKQRLFDDHLWLSVTRRPAYSSFTRVQRFVCATALLFLTMVTNAMFYQGREADRQAVRGVQLGPVQINYRSAAELVSSWSLVCACVYRHPSLSLYACVDSKGFVLVFRLVNGEAP